MKILLIIIIYIHKITTKHFSKIFITKTDLLEKSRVVNPAKDERTFHIFYHLLGGADQALLDKLHLTRNFSDYEYLKKSNCTTVPGLNDKTQFDAINNALDCIGFKQDQKDTLFKCISAILHVGNLKYKKDESDDDKAIIENPERTYLFYYSTIKN